MGDTQEEKYIFELISSVLSKKSLQSLDVHIPRTWWKVYNWNSKVTWRALSQTALFVFWMLDIEFNKTLNILYGNKPLSTKMISYWTNPGRKCNPPLPKITIIPIIMYVKCLNIMYPSALTFPQLMFLDVLLDKL